MTAMPLIILGFLVLTLCVAGILEYQFHLRSLSTIPLRIHVNGTRGKSSVTRLVAAIIEQYHDDKGMQWPTIIAPFQIIIIPINAHKSPQVAEAADDIYKSMRGLGIEVLLDDREGHRPGAKFADAELMGIPHRIVVGERGLKTDTVEYANRQTGESSDLPIEGLETHFRQIIDRELNS